LHPSSSGTAVAQWLRCCAKNRKVACSIPAGVSGFFIDIKSFRSHYGPGVESAFNRKEYQEYFYGDKGGRSVRLTNLPPSCAVFKKSGSLNFLEPSGLFWVCDGTDLLLPLPLIINNIVSWWCYWEINPRTRAHTAYIRSPNGSLLCPHQPL
jgi:hypothetical protein